MDHPYDFRVPDFSGDLDPGPYLILDPYYIGVVEGMVRHYGFEPDVRIHAIEIANAVLDIRW